MNSKKRAFLKKKAHDLEPIVRIGKEGLNENLIKSVLEAIDSRELIKVKILQNCEEDKNLIYSKLMDNKEFELVGMIGRTIIIFKENKEKPIISLEWNNRK
ncbi:ribosome assembly RNA-binding protein YhbY [Fusobacterium russii]|uniref:ribosome assembly RNA-binding protein YhbY n=1 Tax=Fusobacterium russii TaxID=854 RepID=UPI0003A3083F|nr:ribosome assembly RNA-binding protein YhbY [Fusobacterium russii]